MKGRWLEVDHEKLGALRVPEDEILRFDGIPGFPDARRFALVVHDRDEQVAWLACFDDPKLALPVVDLRELRADACDDLTREELDAVSAEDASCVDLLGIVNMRYSPPRVNHEAPLLIHSGTRQGVQLIREQVPDPGTREIGSGRRNSDRVESPDVEGPRQHPR